MKLETSKLSIDLVVKTKKIVDIKNALGNKNFEEGIFQAQKECDREALSKIIYTLAEGEGNIKPFISSTVVYDFMDDYMKENKKTYEDIYKEVMEVINSQGFFNKKMTEEQLNSKLTDPTSSINMDTLIEKAAGKAMEAVVVEEFKGFKG